MEIIRPKQSTHVNNNDNADVVLCGQFPNDEKWGEQQMADTIALPYELKFFPINFHFK